MARLAVGLTFAAPLRAQTTRACTPQWLPAISIVASSGAPVYVETPSIAPLGAKDVLLGVPVFLWTSKAVFADSGERGAKALANVSRDAIGLSVSGGRAILIAPPTAGGSPRRPLAISASPDAAEVFWFTASDSSRVGSGESLWHARLSTHGWTQATSLVDAQQLTATLSGAALSIRGERVEVVVAGTNNDAARTAGVVFVWRARGIWHHEWIETGALGPGAVALAETRDQRVTVAYTGGGRGRAATNPPGLYVIQSATTAEALSDSTRWSPPRLVVGLAGPPPIHPSLLLTNDGTLHLLWADRSPDPESNVARIHHLVSADGIVWTAAASLALPATADWFQAVPDGQGFAIVVREARGGGVRMIEWHGTWSFISDAFSQSALSLPTLGRTADSSLVVTWGTGRPGALPGNPAFPAPALMYARRRVSCAPPSRAP